MAAEPPSSFKAKDVRQLADLSSRQLSDWDGKGALPGTRSGSEGWRRFTPREVFTLMVLSEIRRKFGVPVDRLAFVKNFMLQPGADHFKAAIELIAVLGTGVCILTDLEETFLLDSDIEIANLLSAGMLGTNDPGGYVLVKVNHLVNRILAATKSTIQLDAHGAGYRIMAEAAAQTRANASEEIELLKAIRSGQFKEIEIKLKDGRIIGGDAHGDVSPEDLFGLVRDADYVSLKLTKADGKVVRVRRTVPLKYWNEDSMGQRRGRAKRSGTQTQKD